MSKPYTLHDVMKQMFDCVNDGDRPYPITVRDWAWSLHAHLSMHTKSLDDWRAERINDGYTVTSPSGDGVFVKDSDPRIADEILRQLAMDITATGEIK